MIELLSPVGDFECLFCHVIPLQDRGCGDLILTTAKSSIYSTKLPAGRNQGQEAGKSELSRQWTDAPDGCDLAVEYCVYGKGDRCPEA